MTTPPATFGRVLTAMVTPFHADGSLDLDGAVELCQAAAALATCAADAVGCFGESDRNRRPGAGVPPPPASGGAGDWNPDAVFGPVLEASSSIQAGCSGFGSHRRRAVGPLALG